MREMQAKIDLNGQKSLSDQQELASLKRKVNRLEQTVNQLLAALKRQ